MSSETRGGRRLEAAIAAATRQGRPAISAFLTAGFPTPERFRSDLANTARAADLIEIGVPFSDPMADGVTVQRSSRAALQQGTTLRWILESVAANSRSVPLVLMSYLNPLLAYGFDRLALALALAAIDGLIVPDLPLEEQGPYRAQLQRHGVALIQLVTPATAPERLERIARESDGFLYAVTVNGVSGGAVEGREQIADYLQRVRAVSPRPVLAGFGVRRADDLARLSPPADGVIVGSALIEALERGERPEQFLATLTAGSERR